MSKTIVRCSKDGCRANAESKIAAPWRAGVFSELKTYGYACPKHTNDVLAYAEQRPKPSSITPDESVGAIGIYELPPQ
jgi:hypothetical protein